MTYKLHRTQQRTSMEVKGGGEKEGEKKGWRERSERGTQGKFSEKGEIEGRARPGRNFIQ